MTKKLWSLFLLTALTVTLIGVTVQATNHPELIRQYNFKPEKWRSDETTPVPQSGQFKGTSSTSLGANQPGASPGAIVKANDYMDFMTNHTLPRQVDWATAPFIHFTYTFLPTTDYNVGRTVGYNVWDASGGGSWPMGAGVGCLTSGVGERGGFAAASVDPTDGGAIVGGHYYAVSTDPLRTTMWYDGFPGTCFWGAASLVPDSVSHKNLDPTGTIQVIWPNIAYMVNGSDTDFTWRERAL